MFFSQTEDADSGKAQTLKVDQFIIIQSQDRTPIGQCCVSPIPQFTLFPRSCAKDLYDCHPHFLTSQVTQPLTNMKIRGEEKWPRCHECSRRGNSVEWFCSCLFPHRAFQRHKRKVVFAQDIFMGGGFMWSRFYTL